ncbi:hypothetical protein BU24DRAFT_425893 [Aaosphaeria arxii CBS 175.79]|uniref:Uncharacterized protein n=1 Tax=Aaosphaeria arxii CBS 175.79 TaxID=1450172 RepID=A0A6A5XGK7_9PLEO|nr:uncharacterized protein BU24DRAFT_425893 [Aaosphaeria arxii CBS 175.79]KAF2012063.1 hypothetical protein BU24DRAFT_425893 [Aaosphaeria arxii CBS 175.79]
MDRFHDVQMNNGGRSQDEISNERAPKTYSKVFSSEKSSEENIHKIQSGTRWNTISSRPIEYAKGTWHRSSLLHVWWLEILACILTVATVVAIIVTVRAYEHKPLPQWRYGISLNALIAVYTVIMKGCAGLILAEGISHLKWTSLSRPRPLSGFALHDQASRGPWGAVALLLKHRGGLFSSLGAFVTILVILLDPFSQQIIRLEDCVRVSGDVQASIPRAQHYDESGRHIFAIYQEISRGLRDAAYNGIFADIKPQVQATCRSGNCTFPEEYTTVGFCSKCRDRTDDLIMSTFTNGTGSLKTPWTNATLDGISLVRPNGSIIPSVNGTVMKPVSFLSGGSTFDEIPMIRRERAPENPDPDIYKAYSCRVYPCMKSIRGSMSISELHETIEESGPFEETFSHSMRVGYGAGSINTADLKCVDNDGRRILKDLGYKFDDKTRWLPYNVSAMFGSLKDPEYVTSTDYNPCTKAPAQSSAEICKDYGGGSWNLTEKAYTVVPARCIHSMGYIFYNSVGPYLLADILQGELYDSPNYGYGAFEGKETLMSLWNAGSGNGTIADVDGMVRNMTDAMTTYMRRNGLENFTAPAIGDVHFNTTCVEVRWVWLIYAAATIGLLIVFFLGMVIQTTISQSRLRAEAGVDGIVPPVHDLKSDALAFLFHGFDKESLDMMGTVGATNRQREITKRAKEFNVQLVPTEQGWKLSSQRR